MTFRVLMRQEQTLVKRALDRWGVFDALQHHALLVHEDSAKVCILSSELVGITMKLQPNFAGLAIGILGRKQRFVPTLAGAGLFARVGSRGKYYVKVNENAEKLVLYGRDVMGDSIVEMSFELVENELVIILNPENEAIGIGRTRFSGKSIEQKGRVTITTVADIGSYLRDEDLASGEERRAKMVWSQQNKA